MTGSRWNATRPESLWLYPGDVVFVRGTGWVSRQILKATRELGEEPSVVSHVGLIDKSGKLPYAEILEATGLRVVRRSLAEGYGLSDSLLAIARPTFLSNAKLQKLLAASRLLEGRRYGYLKLPLHLLDAWTGRALRLRRTPVLFRRLGRSGLPICSWHVAVAYREIGYRFGLPGLYAAPDDIYDHVLADASRWSWVIGPDLLPARLALGGV